MRYDKLADDYLAQPVLPQLSYGGVNESGS
jgi:hypothetical protein